MRGVVDPDIERVLSRLAEAPRTIDAWAVQNRREALAERTVWLAGPTIPMRDIRDETVEVSGRSVRIRLYDAHGVRNQPLVVYLHGGGWVLGDLESHDAVCRVIAEVGRSLVCAVDYRLAPESPFPAALEDVTGVLRAIATGRLQLEHWDDVRVGVAGDSAGGNLAAAAASSLQGEIRLSCQLLFYPILDCDLDRATYISGVSPSTLDRSEMAWYWDLYCPPITQRRSPLAAPLRADDFSKLPRTCLVVPEFDILRDEALEFAHRLRAAGVTVEWIDGVGLPHGFMRMLGVVPAARSVARMSGDFLQRAFAIAGRRR